MKLEYIKNLKLTGTALAISTDENTIAILDSAYVLYKLNKKDFKMLSNKKITTKHKKHHHFHKGYSSHGPLQLVTLGGTNSIVLLNITQGIQKLGVPEWHEAPIETSIIASNDKFFVTGTQDGKVYIYDTVAAKLIDSLPQKPDYISNLSLNEENSLLVSSCFNFSTMVYNIETSEIVCEFITEDVIQEALIMDSNTIFMVSRNGNALLYDIGKNEIVYNEHYFDEWPSAIALSLDKQAAIVGVRDGSLHFVDIRNNRLLGRVKTRNVGISLRYKLEEFDFGIGYRSPLGTNAFNNENSFEAFFRYNFDFLGFLSNKRWEDDSYW